MNPYRKIFKALQKAKIAYLVVGGVAVNLYGYNRFTGDIDILLALDEKNLGKFSKLMSTLGYMRRLPIAVEDLEDVKKVKKWIKEKGMTAYTFISEKQIGLDIDILVGYSLKFENFSKKRSLIEIWGMKIPVVSFHDLLKMKKQAAREQDLLDMKRLLELKQI